MLVVCMYDHSEFKNPRFNPSAHVNEKQVFSKTSTVGAVFGNLYFRCPKTPFRLKRRKKSPFPKCPDTCGWGLRFEIQQEKGENRFMVSEKGTTVAQTLNRNTKEKTCSTHLKI